MSADGEVDIDITATDEASGVIDDLQSKLAGLSVAAGDAGGSMDNLSNSTDDAGDSAGFSAGMFLSQLYGLNSIMRVGMQWLATQHSIALGTETYNKDLDSENVLMAKYAPTAQNMGIVTAQNNLLMQQADTILQAHGGSLSAAAAIYQQTEAAAGHYVTTQEAELAVAQQIVAADDKTANAAANLTYQNQRLDLEYARGGLMLAVMANSLYPAVSSGLSTVAGWLGIGGDAAVDATESFDGLAAGFTDMAPEAAIAGDAAVDVAGGLTLAGVAAGAVVVGVAAAAGILIGTGAALVQAHQQGESYIQTYSTWAANIHATMPGIGGDILAAAGMASAGWLQMASDISGKAGPILQNAWTSLSSGVSKASTDFSLDMASMGQAIGTIPARVSSIASSIGSSLSAAWSTITTGAASAFGSVATDIAAIPTTVTTTVQAIVATAITDFQNVVAAISSIVTSIITTVTADVDAGISAIQDFIRWVDQIPSEIMTTINASFSGGSMPGFTGPGYQFGGMVPSTGIYLLHGGEEVLTPAQQAAMSSNFPPTAASPSQGGSGPMQLQNQTIVQLDGQRVASILEQKIIRQRKLASRYRYTGVT